MPTLRERLFNVVNPVYKLVADVVGPSSATNENIAVFDGTTGKKIKDGGPIPNLTSIFSPSISSVQPLMNKIKRDMQDCQILVLGDSTGNDSNEWVHLMAESFVTLFPTHTIEYALYDGSVYPTPTVLATGTGTHKITIYNASVSGARTSYCLGGRWAVMVDALSPDLIFINYGHNQGTSSRCWFADHICLTESLNERHPQAGIVLILQNPGSGAAAGYAGQRATIYETLARLRGYGTVNVHQVFLDYGANWSTDLMSDTLHPNAAGSILWASEVLKLFQWNRNAPIRANLPCSFHNKGFQLLKNNDFAAFASALPDNWATASATPPVCTKDTTNYESPNGYSVLITPAAGVAGALGQYLSSKKTAGQWVSVLARLRRQTGVSNTNGILAISDGAGTTTQDVTGGRDASGGAFCWSVISVFVPANTTGPRVIIYADTGAGNQVVNVDYISAVIGRIPLC